MHYGLCENDEFELLTMTAVCFVLFCFVFSFSYLTLSISLLAFVDLVTSFSCQELLKWNRKQTTL